MFGDYGVTHVRSVHQIFLSQPSLPHYFMKLYTHNFIFIPFITSQHVKTKSQFLQNNIFLVVSFTTIAQVINPFKVVKWLTHSMHVTQINRAIP